MLDQRRSKFFAWQKFEQLILCAFEKHEHGLDVFAQLALWARQALANSHEIRTHVGTAHNNSFSARRAVRRSPPAIRVSKASPPSPLSARRSQIVDLGRSQYPKWRLRLGPAIGRASH